MSYVRKVADKEYTVVFRKTTAQVMDRDRNIVLTANRENNLYYTLSVET